MAVNESLHRHRIFAGWKIFPKFENFLICLRYLSISTMWHVMEYFIFFEKKIIDNLGALSESFLIIEKHRQGNPTLETPGSQRKR